MSASVPPVPTPRKCLAREREEMARYKIPLPSVADALAFRADQMGWNQTEMAKQLGLGRSQYSEIVNGKRVLPMSATKKAFAMGVPANVLLQP